MDDTELGRPPRHARERSRSEPRHVELLRRGDGKATRVRGSKPCERCGEKVKVDVSGPEDSLAVRFARSLLDAPLCEGCSDKAAREEDEAEAQAVLVETIRRRLDSSGVPERWRAVTVDRLDRDAERAAALDAAHEWGIGQRRRGVLLYGGVGRGKTVIAAAAAVERCALGTVRWLSVAELLLKLRMPFGSPDHERALRALDTRGRPALVLDDLDKLKPTEHALQPVYVAVNGWIEAGLPLLVTLNRSIDELAEWAGETFGSALASRLAGYCDIIEVRGRDRRLS